ncbi:hypothetical protein D3C87_1526170 [compost metagenome]
MVLLSAADDGAIITASPQAMLNRKLEAGRFRVTTAVAGSGHSVFSIGSKRPFCALVESGATARS